MVVHKAKVLKIDPVYGEGHEIIEEWAVFEVNNMKMEAFLGISVLYLSDVGKEYDVDFKLMAYDLYRINIEEKILKQISTFPMDPLYVVIGEVVEAGEIKLEVYRGEETKTRIIKVDCGLIIESKVDGWIAEELKIGDYVAIVGKMFGEIVKDGDKIDIQAKDE